MLAWVFVLPAIVYLTALVAVPAVLAVPLAFAETDGGSYRFAGLRGLRAVLEDGVFWRALADTVAFTAAAVAVAVVAGTVLAHLLRADVRGRWLVRFAVLLPWTTPVALSAASWRRLLGSAERLLRYAGEPPGVSVLGRPVPAAVSVVGVHAWRLTPLTAVIVMAGLAAVPRDVRDAARVDGAGPVRRLVEIVVPLTLPVTAVAALVGVLVTAGDLTVAYVLTGGGPGDATQVLPSLAYLRGVEGGDAGRGAAVALFLFPPVLAGVLGLLRVRRAEADR